MPKTSGGSRSNGRGGAGSTGPSFNSRTGTVEQIPRVASRTTRRAGGQSITHSIGNEWNNEQAAAGALRMTPIGGTATFRYGNQRVRVTPQDEGGSTSYRVSSNNRSYRSVDNAINEVYRATGARNQRAIQF